MTQPPDERRRTERVEVNPDFGELSPVYVSNLSEQGVFVHVEQRAPLGTEMDLHFTVLLDDPIVLRGRGRVVRHQESPRGMGVEFTDLAPEMVLRINDVVSRERPVDLGKPIQTDGLRLGQAGLTHDDDTQMAEAAKTNPMQRRAEVVRAVGLGVSPLRRSEGEDPEEAATTLTHKTVDAEIVDEGDDLPQDDGGELVSSQENQP